MINPAFKNFFLVLLVSVSIGTAVYSSRSPSVEPSRIAKSGTGEKRQPMPSVSSGQLAQEAPAPLTPDQKYRHDRLLKMSRSRAEMAVQVEGLKQVKWANQELNHAMEISAQKRKEVTGKILYQEDMQHLSASDLAKIEEANQLEVDASQIHSQRLQELKQQLTSQ